MKNAKSFFIIALNIFISFNLYASLPVIDTHKQGEYRVTTAYYEYNPIWFRGGENLEYTQELENKAVVYYPSNPSNPAAVANGRFPVVFMMHGYFATCYRLHDDNGGSLFDDANLEDGYLSDIWPCSGNTHVSTTSHEGYFRQLNLLASHGFIVVSISANGSNAITNKAAKNGYSGIAGPSRAKLLKTHMDMWKLADSHVNFGGNYGPGINKLYADFRGKVQTSNFGIIGHSTAGIGIAKFLEDNKNRPSAQQHEINAALLLAPAVSLLNETSLIRGTNIGVVLSYCDGSVASLEGIKNFDQAMYDIDSDEFYKTQFLLPGGNHNYFNYYWTKNRNRYQNHAGSFEDWSERIHTLNANKYNKDVEEGQKWLQIIGEDRDQASHCGTQSPDNHRLTYEEQENITSSIYVAFFLSHLKGDKSTLPLLVNRAKFKKFTNNSMEDVIVSSQTPRTHRMDVNKFDSSSALSVNLLGGNVTSHDMTKSICGDKSSPCIKSGNASVFPHRNNALPPLMQTSIEWHSASARIDNEIPFLCKDLSSFESVRFRAALTEDGNSPITGDFMLKVQIIDLNGNIAEEEVGIYYPPGNDSFLLPRHLLNTYLVDLSELKLNYPSVNFNNIGKIRLSFGGGAVAGKLTIRDLALTGQNYANLNSACSV